MRLLDRLQPLGLLVLRLALGAILIAHGYSKVFGGLKGHMSFVGSLGLPSWMGVLSAGTEFFGGILIVLGLLTRLAGLAVAVEMCVAIWKVHFHNGLIGNNGYQFPLMVGVAGFLLLFFGAGPIAIDHVLKGGGGGGGAKK